jgi:1,4-alpha-glucan branching enzyme
MRNEASAREASAGTQARNTIYGETDSELYSAKHLIKPINFYCRAPQARSVQLVCDFNHWLPLPMEPRDDGWWFAHVLLTHGHHQYRFLVDGKPVLDPRAAGVSRDQANEEVSVVAVS